MVLVSHPLCPCTAVSLKALRAVVADHKGELACKVVFAGEKPREASEGMQTAAAIPGAEIEWTTAEQVEAKYGTYTSGQTFLYSPSGRLVFSGGVTPGRGVDQPRYAIDLFDHMMTSGEATKPTPVFGCALKSKQL